MMVSSKEMTSHHLALSRSFFYEIALKCGFYKFSRSYFLNEETCASYAKHVYALYIMSTAAGPLIDLVNFSSYRPWLQLRAATLRTEVGLVPLTCTYLLHGAKSFLRS
jgi:hypothetical protein